MLKQKMIVIAYVFQKLQTVKNLLKSQSKGTFWEQAWTVNM